jgi:hypothetical protein
MSIEVWLKELRIPRDSYRLIMVLPLVYVAWVDGKIQEKERKVILRIAEEHGLLANGGHAVLDHWLAVPPTEEQLKADLRIVNQLCNSHGRFGGEFDADCETLMLAWCQDVADAAGGLLGLRSARGPAEVEALRKISAALDIGRARQWRAFLG